MQTVNDLLTMYVRAASQHVLRMSFVPEQEVRYFDKQVTIFWSQIIQREITSPLFFPLLELGGLGVCCAVDHPHVNGNNPVNGYGLSLRSNTTTTSSTSTTPNHTFPTNELTHLPNSNHLEQPIAYKPLRRNKSPPSKENIHKQLYNSLTDTPTEQAIVLSQSTSHTSAHLMQPRSEAYEIEDRCFRVSVARRLMLPDPTAANPADVVQFCPKRSAAGVICNKPLDPKEHHCYGCRYGGGVDRRHAALARGLVDTIQSHSEVKGI